MDKKNNSNVSGLVLFAKQPDRTSFQSLSIIKKSLETSKVGHTGTLDSFAQGLLVVCVGNLTRLASHITAFDKSYEAVIKFGSETDTLDFTGHVTKHANLLTLENLLKSLKKFSGQIGQTPPVFSALKIDGERASDLIRKGKNVELQKRAITIHSSQIVEIKFDDNLLYSARAFFTSSKVGVTGAPAVPFNTVIICSTFTTASISFCASVSFSIFGIIFTTISLAITVPILIADNAFILV